MADQQKFTVTLPSWIADEDLDEAIQDLIEFIIDRTQAGQGIRENGRRYTFPEYNDEYRKKVKGGQGRVDLTLSSEMLSDIVELDRDGRKVTIGFEPGQSNDKAEGNQLGSYGRDPNPAKARRFLGINKEELSAVLTIYRDE